LKSQYQVALAQRDESEIAYRQSVTQAFGEVSTALSAHTELAESLRQETRSVTAYQESVRLANMRYDNGLSSYFEVLDAQLQLYPAETQRVQYDLGRKVALVNLYKALGGGWKLGDTDWLTQATNAAQSINATPKP
jgi:multidrug efflux system outer membrane protein